MVGGKDTKKEKDKDTTGRNKIRDKVKRQRVTSDTGFGSSEHLKNYCLLQII